MRKSLFIVDYEDDSYLEAVAEKLRNLRPKKTISVRETIGGGAVPKGRLYYDVFVERREEAIGLEHEIKQIEGVTRVTLLGTFQTGFPTKHLETVLALLNKGAYTPEEIHTLSGGVVKITDLAEILPSRANQDPVINPPYECLYGKYVTEDRILAKNIPQSREFMVYNDISYVWRFYTVFSFDTNAIARKVSSISDTMKTESAKRKQLAKKAVDDIVYAMTEALGRSRPELREYMVFLLAGSVYRRDAIETADIDIILLFDNEIIRPRSREERAVRLVINKEIVDFYNREKVYLALSGLAMNVFESDCYRGKDIDVLNAFVLSEPLFGKKIYKALQKDVKSWPVYRQWDNLARDSTLKEIELDAFKFLLLKMGESPAEDKKREAETIAEIADELRKPDLPMDGRIGHARGKLNPSK